MDNLRGAALMTFAMLAFAIEDAFIKVLSDAWSPGQIILALGLISAPVFAIVARLRGAPLLGATSAHPMVLLRNLCEAVGTAGFVTAIALIPLSLASAILQAAPLLVTLGAAVFLGQEVGWRRWTAISVGLAGVLLILRPGLDGFEPAALFAVIGVLGLAGRDVATRAIPPHVRSEQLAFLAYLTIAPTGALLVVLGGEGFAPLRPAQIGPLAGAALVGFFAYAALVAASRIGDVAAITPFRYTRLLFAMGIGVTVFGERPDALTLLGAAIVVASGLYTLLREARLRRGRA